jgi:hypothetical protein
MKIRSATLLILCLLLNISTASQSSLHAQRRAVTLSQEAAPQTPQAAVAKVETSGGPKTETRNTGRRKALAKALRGTITTKTAEMNPELAIDPNAPKVSGPSGAKAASTYDVGIIAGANGCPPGSDLLSFYTDSEDYHNNNSSTGWLGAIIQDKNITFKFCRVDGTKFSRPSASSYAVLQLDPQCPPGSDSFARELDNEDDDNNNTVSINPYYSGKSFAPNTSDKYSSATRLKFCLFSAPTPTPWWTFPDFGIEYGVFAPSDLPGALDTGSLYSDDQDILNENTYDYNYTLLVSQAGRIISGSVNTEFQIVKVKSGPVPPTLQSVSLDVTSVKGGDSCNEPVLTVNLSSPAPTGGLPFTVSSSNTNVAWIFAGGNFIVPAGQSSESLSCFMGTKNVSTNKQVSLTVTVNGNPGYVNLNIKK